MTDNWRVSLENSVFALREATEDYRSALHLAQSGRWAVDLVRLRELPGTITVRETPIPHPDSGAPLQPGHSGGTRRPIDDAVTRIGRLYGTLTQDLEAEYERRWGRLLGGRCHRNRARETRRIQVTNPGHIPGQLDIEE